MASRWKKIAIRVFKKGRADGISLWAVGKNIVKECLSRITKPEVVLSAIILIGVLVYAAWASVEDMRKDAQDWKKKAEEKPSIVTSFVTSPYEANAWPIPTPEQQAEFTRIASIAPSGTTFYTNTPQAAWLGRRDV